MNVYSLEINAIICGLKFEISGNLQSKGQHSLISKHAITHNTVAKEIDSDSQIVVVSLKKVVVDLEVCVAYLQHVLKVTRNCFIRDFLKFSKVSLFISFFMRNLLFNKFFLFIILNVIFNNGLHQVIVSNYLCIFNDFL